MSPTTIIEWRHDDMTVERYLVFHLGKPIQTKK